MFENSPAIQPFPTPPNHCFTSYSLTGFCCTLFLMSIHSYCTGKNIICSGTPAEQRTTVCEEAGSNSAFLFGTSKASLTTFQVLLLHRLRHKKRKMFTVGQMTWGIFDFCTKPQLLSFIPAFASRYKAKIPSASQLFSPVKGKLFSFQPRAQWDKATAVPEVP